MTQPQATAEVFWTAFQAMKPSEREAFIGKLMKDENLAEDLRYAAVIEKRKDEPTVSLDYYLNSPSGKAKLFREHPKRSCGYAATGGIASDNF